MISSRSNRPLTSSEFSEGPTRSRRPTDWICGILFVLMWIAVGIIGVVYGSNETKSIDKPRDYDHNVCDEEHPLLYIASFDVRRTVCVQSCPSEAGNIIQCKKNSMFRFCPVSRGTLVMNNFYSLCHVDGMDIQIHTIKGNASSFAGSIIEAVGAISKTAGVISVAGLLMTLLTLFMPGVTIWAWIVGLEVGLCLLGGLFLFMFVQGRMPFCAVNIQHEEKYVTFLLLGIGCFVAAVASFFTLLFRGNLGHLRSVLILARAFIRVHWYIIPIAVLLSGLSLAMMALLARLLEITQSNVRMNYLNRAAYDQFMMAKQESVTLIVLLAIVYLWSHGFMVALSSFFGEALAVHWYFNQKHRQIGESVKQTSILEVLKYIGIHFGTICYHGSTVYLPEFVGAAVCGSAQAVPCCLNYVSIYSLFRTVLSGQYFTLANQECWHLLNRVKTRCREKYMLGHFYVRVSKGLIWVTAMLSVAWFMASENPYFFGHGLFVIPPLLVKSNVMQVTTLMALEVGTHFSMLLGTVSDTIVISYVADLEMNHENAESVPQLVRALLAPPQPHS